MQDLFLLSSNDYILIEKVKEEKAYTKSERRESISYMWKILVKGEKTTIEAKWSKEYKEGRVYIWHNKALIKKETKLGYNILHKYSWSYKHSTSL